MSDDASPYPLTATPSGQPRPSFFALGFTPVFFLGLVAVICFELWRGRTNSPAFWLSIPSLLLLLVALKLPLQWWRNAVVWFEWKDDVLRYRLIGRAQVHSLLLPEILNVRPISQPTTASGFEVVISGRALRFEYDRAGHAVRLRDILIERLRQTRPAG